ncbi:hypothetical protein FRC11_003902, partial [Ceratobasidium sp. 423]
MSNNETVRNADPLTGSDLEEDWGKNVSHRVADPKSEKHTKEGKTPSTKITDAHPAAPATEGSPHKPHPEPRKEGKCVDEADFFCQDTCAEKQKLIDEAEGTTEGP